MKHYLGNMSSDICESLILECLEHDVEPYHGNRTLDPDHVYYKDHLEQKRLAEACGYTQNNSIEFRHYKANIHYSKKYNDEIGKASNSEVLQSFVSEIRPGKCAPWHWDIPSLDEDLGIVREYKQEDLIRGICFIDKPKHGQAFMVEEECFYMEAQGNIYRYPKLSSWHAGFNAGLETKFLFTFTAIKKV